MGALKAVHKTRSMIINIIIVSYVVAAPPYTRARIHLRAIFLARNLGSARVPAYRPAGGFLPEGPDSATSRASSVSFLRSSCGYVQQRCQCFQWLGGAVRCQPRPAVAWTTLTHRTSPPRPAAPASPVPRGSAGTTADSYSAAAARLQQCQSQQLVALGDLAAAANQPIIKQLLPVEGPGERHHRRLVVADCRLCGDVVSPSGRTTTLLMPRFLIFSGMKVVSLTWPPSARCIGTDAPAVCGLLMDR